MVKITTVRGIRRYLFMLRVDIGVFFYYFFYVITGKITFRRFVLFLRRMLIFSQLLKENKFIKVNGKTRMGLYIPGYKSKPYFTASNKFLEFDTIMPAITVLLSVTSACKYKCEHCYQRRDTGKDVDINKLIEVAKKLQDMGMAYIIIEGGEPFLVYEKTKKLIAAIDERSEIWLNTNGDGITRERVRELKSLGLTVLQFSLHYSEPDEFNTFFCSDKAWANMENGVRIAYEEGVPVSFNMCLTKDTFHNGRFEKIMDRVKELNGFIIQVIHPKSSGAWLETDLEKFTEEDFKKVRDLVLKYNLDKKYKDYPAISAQIMEEDQEAFGCTAGGIDRFYINAKGDVQPCEFVHLSFGNIAEEDFEIIYNRMREKFYPSSETWVCDMCSKDMARVYKDNNLKSLPLAPKLAKQVYENWDRGQSTKFYLRVNEELNDKRSDN